MKTVLVTGSNGFIGRNLVASLSARADLEVLTFDLDDSMEALQERLRRAEFIFHLAGVNRPKEAAEFEAGNAGLTQTIVDFLKAEGRPVPLLISSSAQAALENPYGLSKRHAEELVHSYGLETGAPVYVYRLPGVFGKWSRPNYNTVVATFCHNVANGIPLEVHDPSRGLELVHVDDVVAEFQKALDGALQVGSDGLMANPRVFQITLGELAETIRSFPETRNNRELPAVGEDLTRLLYSMYLSYLPTENFGYALDVKRDPRGWLAEVFRSPSLGQIFVSTTRPGITRGHHWHHTKTEKFLVVQGQAVIRFRQLDGSRVIEYPVSGEEPRVVDIPPGYTHSITNTGTSDLVTLFWASEPFDPGRPDTNALEV